MATELVTRLRMGEARRELERAREGSCSAEPFTIRTAFVYAHLLRHSEATEVARVRETLAVLRADPSQPPGLRASIDYIEGRLLLGRGEDDDQALVAEGRRLLERAILTSQGLPESDADARRTRAYATTLLVHRAATAGDWAAALSLLAREADLSAPPACVVGASLEQDVVVVAARGADGRLAGSFVPLAPGETIDPARIVPPSILDAVRGCPEIDVIARPPLHGQARLLPPTMSWRYRTARRHAAAPAAIAPKHVVVAHVEPPASLGLAQLAPWRTARRTSARVVALEGPAATPQRVLAELRDATEVEIHAHGLVNLADSDASFVALSPGPDGRWALTASDLREVELAGSPLVVLAACETARPAPRFHETWSLPAALVAAGARSVIASPSLVDDNEAGPFFELVRARIAAGATVATAVRDARAQWRADHASTWVDDLLVFE
jgi:hypothetical protein